MANVYSCIQLLGKNEAPQYPNTFGVKEYEDATITKDDSKEIYFNNVGLIECIKDYYDFQYDVINKQLYNYDDLTKMFKVGKSYFSSSLKVVYSDKDCVVFIDSGDRSCTFEEARTFGNNNHTNIFTGLEEGTVFKSNKEYFKTTHCEVLSLESQLLSEVSFYKYCDSTGFDKSGPYWLNDYAIDYRDDSITCSRYFSGTTTNVCCNINCSLKTLVKYTLKRKSNNYWKDNYNLGDRYTFVNGDKNYVLKALSYRCKNNEVVGINFLPDTAHEFSDCRKDFDSFYNNAKKVGNLYTCISPDGTYTNGDNTYYWSSSLLCKKDFNNDSYDTCISNTCFYIGDYCCNCPLYTCFVCWCGGYGYNTNKFAPTALTPKFTLGTKDSYSITYDDLTQKFTVGNTYNFSYNNSGNSKNIGYIYLKAVCVVNNCAVFIPVDNGCIKTYGNYRRSCNTGTSGLYCYSCNTDNIITTADSFSTRMYCNEYYHWESGLWYKKQIECNTYLCNANNRKSDAVWSLGNFYKCTAASQASIYFYCCAVNTDGSIVNHCDSCVGIVPRLVLRRDNRSLRNYFKAGDCCNFSAPFSAYLRILEVFDSSMTASCYYVGTGTKQNYSTAANCIYNCSFNNCTITICDKKYGINVEMLSCYDIKCGISYLKNNPTAIGYCYWLNTGVYSETCACYVEINKSISSANISCSYYLAPKFTFYEI